MNCVNQHTTTIIQYTGNKKYFQVKDLVLLTSFSISALARMQIIIFNAVKLGMVFLDETSRFYTSSKPNRERSPAPSFLAYMPKTRFKKKKRVETSRW